MGTFVVGSKFIFLPVEKASFFWSATCTFAIRFDKSVEGVKGLITRVLVPLPSLEGVAP